MEGHQQPKRPRLNSWRGDSPPTLAHQQLAESPTQGYPHSAYPQQAQYTNQQATMDVWDNKSSIQQAGQLSDSRSQSAGGQPITPPPTGGHYAIGHRNQSTAAHPLSHDMPSPENQGYSSYPPSGAPLQSEVDNNGNPTGPPNGSSNSQASTRQELKPLQTNQPGGFQDSHVQAFYPAQPHQGGPSAGPTADHRQSELGSPDGAGSLQAGPSPMLAPGGYTGLHTAGGMQGGGGGGGGGGVGASPVAPSAGVGGLMSGSQGAIQTTYPPRRKAIRAAQVCRYLTPVPGVMLTSAGLRCV